jgi:hypothetical protein
VKTSFTQFFSKIRIVQKSKRFVEEIFLGKIQNDSINQNGGFRQSNFRKDALNPRLNQRYFHNFIKKKSRAQKIQNKGQKSKWW